MRLAASLNAGTDSSIREARLVPDLLRFDDDVQLVRNRWSIGWRVLDGIALYAQYLADSRSVGIALNILIQRLPFTGRSGWQTLFVEVAFAYQQTLLVSNQRMLARYGLCGHFEESRFTGAAETRLSGGHAGKRQRVATFGNQLHARGVATRQQVHAEAAMEALRNRIVERGAGGVGAGHHGAHHLSDLQPSFLDAVTG